MIFSILQKYAGKDWINWLDPLICPGIFPKMKYYKRYFGYNIEPSYVKMGVSYQLLLKNHVVVYVGDISKSRMIDTVNINILCYKNNMRFYSSYDSFLEDKDDIFKGNQLKSYLFTTNCYMEIENKEAADKAYALDYLNGKLQLMSEYEFDYLLWAGFKCKKLLEEIGEHNIDKIDNKLKIEKFSKLTKCINNPDYDI